MHKKFKFLIICSLVITILLSGYKEVFATSTFGNHKYYKGVGNITVYIDKPSGTGYWQNFITNAANNWMYTGVGVNPIYMNFVSSNNGSTMDIYTKKNAYWIAKGSGPNILAETLFYDSNNTYFNPGVTTKNWVWTEIYINDDNFRKSSFSMNKLRNYNP